MPISEWSITSIIGAASKCKASDDPNSLIVEFLDERLLFAVSRYEGNGKGDARLVLACLGFSSLASHRQGRNYSLRQTGSIEILTNSNERTQYSSALVLEVPASHPELFTTLVVELATRLSTGEEPAQCGDMVQAIAHSSSEPKETVNGALGLWGELVFMLTFGPSLELIDGWHVSKDQVYDFTWGNRVIDVKTTISQKRNHWLSDSQFNKNTSNTAYLASLLTQEDSAGIDVLSLGRQLERHIQLLGGSTTNFRRKFVDAITGMGVFALTRKWNLELGTSSLQFFALSSLPVPKVEPPFLGAKWLISFDGELPVEI